MTLAHARNLASLRTEVERLETGGGERLLERRALGHAGVDAALKGGLALGSLHEVFAGAGAQAAAATGFALGLTRRMTQGKRFVLWIRQDFSAIESGDLSMTGFAELGLDPRHLVVVRAPTAEIVLRTAADGLACNALGAVIAEIWGETRAFDLVASRKLTLAAGESGVPALDAAAWRNPAGFHGRDALDRARRAFAAGPGLAGMGLADLRRRARPQPPWADRTMDHGMDE